MAELRSADPIRQDRAAVFAVMAVLPAGYYRAKDLAEMAEVFAGDDPGIRPRPDLWEALFAVAASRDQRGIDPRRLGRWLARNANNISSGFRLFVDASDATRPKYSVKLATAGTAP